MATWPPSPSEKFINLAAISREKVTTEELHKFMLATLNKGVDTILQTKAPVSIEQLLDTKPGESKSAFWWRGLPGLGKRPYPGRYANAGLRAIYSSNIRYYYCCGLETKGFKML